MILEMYKDFGYDRVQFVKKIAVGKPNKKATTMNQYTAFFTAW